MTQGLIQRPLMPVVCACHQLKVLQRCQHVCNTVGGGNAGASKCLASGPKGRITALGAGKGRNWAGGVEDWPTQRWDPAVETTTGSKALPQARQPDMGLLDSLLAKYPVETQGIILWGLRLSHGRSHRI